MTFPNSFLTTYSYTHMLPCMGMAQPEVTLLITLYIESTVQPIRYFYRYTFWGLQDIHFEII